MNTIENTLKSVGWKELYPETLNRISFFRDAFREFFTNDEISDEELDKCVAYDFAIYGQEFVYDIYSITKNNITKSLHDTFKDFVIATVDVISTIEEECDLKPENYIDLFLEYCFSLVIKR